MDNIPSFNKLEYIEPLSGSTGAKLYKNNRENKWVVKQAKSVHSYEQIKYEFLANDIYDLLNIPVAKHKLDTKNQALILKYVDGVILSDVNKDEYAKAKKELCQGFVVDAFLANWDVIGLNQDNILIPHSNTPAIRVDNGGTFMFRAKGGQKPYKNIVSELDTMRKSDIAPQASKIFGEITDTEINEQIKTIIVPNYHKILNLVDKFLTENKTNLNTDKIQEKFKDRIKGRLDYLIERTVWTNASAFKNTIKEVSTPEYIPEVQKAVIQYFRAGWLKNFKPMSNRPGNVSDTKLLEFVNKTLKDHNAVISGGFILKAIGAFVDEKSVDMDIYVPTEKAEKFREIMIKLFDASSTIKHVVSNTPGSFFKKNGILSVTKYSKNVPQYAEMDIIEVNSDRTPIDVVKNFDLTFCENWYDGENIFMTYPEHVKTKSGFLENHYLNILFSANPVLINRMKKYINRGFKININNPVTKSIEDITEGIKDGTKYQPSIENKIEEKNKVYGSYGITSKKSKNILNLSILPYIEDHIEKRSKNPKELTPFDIMIIKSYTGFNSTTINRFLYSGVSYVPHNLDIFRLLQLKIPKKDINQIEYNKQLLYYYFVNLYNTVQKGGIISKNTLFPVYRGSKTFYLNENKDRFSYTNSFMSTTINKDVAKKFGAIFLGAAKNTLYRHIIYVFFVHPLCIYSNIANISKYIHEQEVLFTPYHRYVFVEDTIKDEIFYKKYLLLPTDLIIPNTFETFMLWKDNIKALSKTTNQVRLRKNIENIAHNLGIESTEELVSLMVKESSTPKTGGRLEQIISQTDPFFNINSTRRNITIKKLNTKNKRYDTTIIRMNKTPEKMMPSMKNNTRKKNITANIDMNSSRFTDPIPSFLGKEPTKDEMKIIDNMIQIAKNYKL